MIDYINFKKIFLQIKRKGWIKSKRKGPTGIGYTFEELLGKPEENFNIPDYGCIEIKTKRRFTKGNITLFTATPDGDYLFPIKMIQHKFGYPDKDYHQYRIFNGAVYGNKITKIGLFYKFTIKVDRDRKEIRLFCYTISGKLVDSTVTWSFDMIESKLKRKLSYLAIVIASSKYIDDEEYFWYNSMQFYRLKSFETFLNLIEDGKIRITFKIGIFKSESKLGKTYDRGTSFDINLKDVNCLFDKFCD